MGKREEVKQERLDRDFYPTIDADAIVPLIKWFEKKYPRVDAPYVSYVEPCAGNGSLVSLLAKYLSCEYAIDIEPGADFVYKQDCLDITFGDIWFGSASYFITNPPFKWSSLQPILNALPNLLPTWLLLPADMMHNKRMGPYMEKCSDIVSVGRLYWFADKPIKGVDNYCWYLFNYDKCETVFHGRSL